MLVALNANEARITHAATQCLNFPAIIIQLWRENSKMTVNV